MLAQPVQPANMSTNQFPQLIALTHFWQRNAEISCRLTELLHMQTLITSSLHCPELSIILRFFLMATLHLPPCVPPLLFILCVIGAHSVLLCVHFAGHAVLQAWRAKGHSSKIGGRSAQLLDNTQPCMTWYLAMSFRNNVTMIQTANANRRKTQCRQTNWLARCHYFDQYVIWF